MPLYRCQVELLHQTGIPRHNVTNTFWMETPPGAATAAQAEAVAEVVRDFYVVGPNPVMDVISPVIATVGPHKVKVAPIVKSTGDDERGPGLPPLWTENFDFVGRAATTAGTPSEVALCLSYKNVSGGTVPPARKRGRIFVGPLEAVHVGVRAGLAVPVPTAALINLLIAAGQRLRDNTAPVIASWVVYSRPYAGRDEIVRPGRPTLPAIPARAGATFPVTQVSVDDAFDTQRRRGEAPVSRTIG